MGSAGNPCDFSIRYSLKSGFNKRFEYKLMIELLAYHFGKN
jgi:hypothetical protein